jgi:hypothetical protein
MSETEARQPLAGHRDSAARFSRPALIFLLGIPLAWAVLLLFHPGGDGKELYLDLEGNVTAWMVVHLGMLVFIPLMAGAIFLLLRGVEGTAAQVGRIALVPFVVFYSAFETLQGIGNGVLVSEVNGLPESERATGAALVQDFGENILLRDFGVFSNLGSLGLIVALIATGMALHRHAGAPQSVAVLLGVSGFLITAHPPPFGPIGLVLFIVAVVLFLRSESRTPAPAAVARARPA